MKSYDWLIDVSDDYDGLIVYVTFNPYDYEDSLDTVYDQWENEEGQVIDDTYFEVDGVTVSMDSSSFFIESKDDEHISKVLEYIDKAVS